MKFSASCCAVMVFKTVLLSNRASSLCSLYLCIKRIFRFWFPCIFTLWSSPAGNSGFPQRSPVFPAGHHPLTTFFPTSSLQIREYIWRQASRAGRPAGREGLQEANRDA